ncbi:hypothetical protein FIU95_12485 [Microbulbifer sp. THAF38]|nr:hypothetical protein FIU95_12485 [Microbulbifer sp. THAF38]
MNIQNLVVRRIEGLDITFGAVLAIQPEGDKAIAHLFSIPLNQIHNTNFLVSYSKYDTDRSCLLYVNRYSFSLKPRMLSRKI